MINSAAEIYDIDMSSPLIFTDKAAKQVKILIEDDGSRDLKLRVFVSGGGCSGFQYGFTFEEEVNEDDTLVQKISLRYW